VVLRPEDFDGPLHADELGEALYRRGAHDRREAPGGLTMGATVRVVKDTNGAGLAAVARRMRSLKRTVLVGVAKGATEADGTPIALVAAVHEFGSPERGIPERSFIRAGIRKGRPMFKRLSEAGLKALVKGTITEAMLLGRLGMAGVAAVQ